MTQNILLLDSNSSLSILKCFICLWKIAKLNFHFSLFYFIKLNDMLEIKIMYSTSKSKNKILVICFIFNHTSEISLSIEVGKASFFSF